MKIKILVTAITLLFVLRANAEQVGEVKQVDVDSHQVAVELSASGHNRGDKLILTFSDGSQCSLTVRELQGSIALTQFSNCPKKEDIKAGQAVERSLFKSQSAPRPTQSAQPTYGLDGPTSNESWYTLWGLGFSSISYGTETQVEANELASAPGVDNSSFSYDFLGFFWPLSGHKTMLGFVMNVASDAYSGAGGDLYIHQYLFGFSAQHFFGANIGDGWFLRADVGRAWYVASLNTSTAVANYESESGFGLLLGGGYGFAIGDETRLLVNLNYARRRAEGDAAGATSLTAGFLF